MRGHGLVSRIRWMLMPWWACAWRFRRDFPGPHPARWWEHCIGSMVLWLDKSLERLPGADLFGPMPQIICDCDECRAASREPV